MRVFLTLIALTISSAGISERNKLDLDTLKCRELFEMQREQIKIVLAWLQGYYLEEDAPSIVDLDKLSTDEKKLSSYCQMHPEEDVSSAAEEVFGK